MTTWSNLQLADGSTCDVAVDGTGLIASVAESAGPGGGFILPGFNDSHCHILPTGLDLLRLNLSSASTPEEVLGMVRTEGTEGGADDWLLATHYDQTKFPGAAHLSRHQVDAACPDRPVLLRHSNGHAAVANSKALQLAGVTPGQSDPAGGAYVRDEAGELTGVLLERAMEDVYQAVPVPDLNEMVEAILRAGEAMSALGITSATDMMTGRYHLARELEAYRIASERGCKVRLRLYLQWSQVFGKRALAKEPLDELIKAMEPGTCRVSGAKIFADGAIGSATASISSTYRTTGDHGQLIYNPARLNQMVQTATEAGWRVAVHAIGDDAVDKVLDAFEASGAPGSHRLEHAMILNDAQINRIARTGCFVTMQPEFLSQFGHAYRAQLQPSVYPRLKRLKSCLDAGIPLALNSDRPIVPGDPWAGIAAASNRPQGFDPAENIPIGEAIRLYTEGGAACEGEPDTGRIEAGCKADFQVFSGRPGPGSKPLSVVLGGRVVQGGFNNL